MIRSIAFVSRFTLSCLLLELLFTVTPSQGQDVPKTQTTPAAVARESFEALKRRDIAIVVSLLHPDETKRFKAFAVGVFKYDRPDDEIQQIRKLLAPFNSTESVAGANESDLLAAFLKNLLTSTPGFDQILAEAKLEILGEIVESPDTVHVVGRTIYPRPQPVTYRKHDGRWYQLFDEAVTRAITAFEQKEHFRKKNPTIEDFADLLLKTRIGKFDVIGYVKDGANAAQVLCRIEMKSEDFGFSLFKCYPVRKGEPAWNHLNDRDKTKLVKVLRSQWGM